MAKQYTVKQGDHLSGIAADNGFTDFHSIWDHPQNAELRSSRNPHILFPGDSIYIPDPEEKSATGATGMVHIFKVNKPALFLRLRILDIVARPLANALCELGVRPGKMVSKKTEETGVVEPDEEIDENAHEAELRVRPASPTPQGNHPLPRDTKFDLKIGNLNPETKLSGQQARLNNLGYFAGFELNDLEQFLWAAEEFECDRIKRSQSPVTSRPTLIAIPPADQNGAEEFGDPQTKTGIQESKLYGELKKWHGC